MTTGTALVHLRVRAGWTKTQLAKAAGTTVTIVTFLENDKWPWTAELGSRLLQALTDDADRAVVMLAWAQERANQGAAIYGVPVVLH